MKQEKYEVQIELREFLTNKLVKAGKTETECDNMDMEELDDFF